MVIAVQQQCLHCIHPPTVVGSNTHGASVLLALEYQGCEQLFDLHHVLVILLLRLHSDRDERNRVSVDQET